MAEPMSIAVGVSTATLSAYGAPPDFLGLDVNLSALLHTNRLVSSAGNPALDVPMEASRMIPKRARGLPIRDVEEILHSIEGGALT
jgi:hypothetical protein